jgi:hypothetical protein
LDIRGNVSARFCWPPHCCIATDLVGYVDAHFRSYAHPDYNMGVWLGYATGS